MAHMGRSEVLRWRCNCPEGAKPESPGHRPGEWGDVEPAALKGRNGLRANRLFRPFRQRREGFFLGENREFRGFRERAKRRRSGLPPSVASENRENRRFAYDPKSFTALPFRASAALFPAFPGRCPGLSSFTPSGPQIFAFSSLWRSENATNRLRHAGHIPVQSQSLSLPPDVGRDYNQQVGKRRR